jgi:HEPN domain-containing protein
MHSMDRSRDWLAQAHHLLDQAEWLKKGMYFDGACFNCQQAAEMAVKALHHSLGRDVWGHMIARLLAGLQDVIDVPEDVFSSANELDSLYIPTRYPNGFEHGSPKDYFSVEDIDAALMNCRGIVRFCEENMRDGR